METADVVIAGAGIIGLSLALDLASQSPAPGLKVVVLERGRAMEEASWAAAGMLAAHDPENPPELRQLAQYSLALYPNWLAQVERLSGRKVPFRTIATLQVIDPSSQAAESLRNSPTFRRLTPAETAAIDPHLQSGRRNFLLLQEQSLDPRDLCAALPRAVRAAGVELRENSLVISIDAQPSEDTIIVQTDAAPIAAKHFVNAAGAWAANSAFAPNPAATPEITPRKGQMATVRLRGPETLNHVLRTPDIYLVPRGDGRVAIGATVEQTGFDKTVEPPAIANLLRAAAQLWPPIAHAELLESWAGLRPASSDELPLIGPLAPATISPNTTAKSWIGARLWIAAGHFRNGILLAPGTARSLSQAIRGQALEIDLAPFHPEKPLSPSRLPAACS